MATSGSYNLGNIPPLNVTDEPLLGRIVGRKNATSKRLLGSDLPPLTNAHVAPPTAIPIVMVFYPPWQKWLGITTKDAMSGKPIVDCKHHASFSQDRVETMRADRAVGEQVLWIVQQKGYAIIDWVRLEELR